MVKKIDSNAQRLKSHRRICEAVLDADNHVVEKCSCKSVKRTHFLLIIRTGDCDGAAVHIDGESVVELLRKSSEGSLYGNVVAVLNGNGNAGGNRYRCSAYS